jgi:hypothetical protein
VQGEAGQECRSEVRIAESACCAVTTTFSVVPLTTDAQPVSASATAPTTQPFLTM